jgi:hypothetical protein
MSAHIDAQVAHDLLKHVAPGDRTVIGVDHFGPTSIPAPGASSFKTGQREDEEALKIYRELVKKEPETYLPYVVATLNNLRTPDLRKRGARVAERN